MTLRVWILARTGNAESPPRGFFWREEKGREGKTVIQGGAERGCGVDGRMRPLFLDLPPVKWVGRKIARTVLLPLTTREMGVAGYHPHRHLARLGSLEYA